MSVPNIPPPPPTPGDVGWHMVVPIVAVMGGSIAVGTGLVTGNVWAVVGGAAAVVGGVAQAQVDIQAMANSLSGGTYLGEVDDPDFLNGATYLGEVDDPNFLNGAPPPNSSSPPGIGTDGGSMNDPLPGGDDSTEASDDSMLAEFGWGSAGQAANGEGWPVDSGEASSGSDEGGFSLFDLLGIGSVGGQLHFNSLPTSGGMEPSSGSSPAMLQITPERLSLIANQFRNAGLEVSSIAGSLQGHLSHVVEPGFGAWPAKFEGAWEAWRTRMLYLESEMNNMSSVLDLASEVYRRADEQAFIPPT